MARLPSIIVHQAGAPVVTGCPFPAESAPDGIRSAAIRFADGTDVAAQVTALTPAMPGGMRWMELSFRSPAAGRAEVRLSPALAASGHPDLATPDGRVLDNGTLRVELNPDSAFPPVAISWKGGSGTLSPEWTVDGRRVAEAPGGRRELRVTRNGAFRCRVELSGQALDESGAPSLRYRLALELWRDMPALRVDWMTSHELPGVPEVTVSRAVLVGNWSLGKGATERVFLQPHHTNEYQPRLVRNPDPVAIVADETGSAPHVRDFAMLRDDSVYNHYCRPGAVHALPWLQLQGSSGTVCAALKDFIESRPNAFASEGNRLDYEMIPEGQSLTWPQGRRREQNLLLSFAAAGEGAEPKALANLAEGVFALGRAAPAPETLAALRCFDLDRALPFEPGRHVRINLLLDRFCELTMPGGKWDLGDTPNWHYSLGSGAELNPPWVGGIETFPPKRFKAKGGLFPNEIAGFIEPVWTNNEYDMIHALATEMMRTGKASHATMLRWSVRHNIEVDFVVLSDDPRHHRGAPFHSHFHNNKGCITSHIWTQGLLEYYCLTGDDDVRDTALALGEKILEIDHSGVTANWKFDREIGWALLALVCLAEAGYGQFLEEAKGIAAFLRGYDRKRFDQRVNLSGGTEGRTLARQMIDCGFGYASMVEALEKQQRLTGDPALGGWLDDLLRELKDECWNKVADGELPTVHNMIGQIMAIGYERLGDPDFLAAGEVSLEHYLDPAFPEKHPLGAENGEGKPSAMSYRALYRFCGALARSGRLERFEYPALRGRR